MHVVVGSISIHTLPRSEAFRLVPRPKEPLDLLEPEPLEFTGRKNDMVVGEQTNQA
jgi:hypothetical protein